MDGEALRDYLFLENLDIPSKPMEKTVQFYKEHHSTVVEPDMERGRSREEAADILKIQALEIALQALFHLPPHFGNRSSLDSQIKFQAMPDIVIAFRASVTS